MSQKPQSKLKQRFFYTKFQPLQILANFKLLFENQFWKFLKSASAQQIISENSADKKDSVNAKN